MGFFTDEESAALTIQRMSLHIVGGGGEFVPRDELEVDHADFLLKVIKSIASDAVHSFNQVSITRDTMEAIARGDEAFAIGAQTLSRQFHRLHETARMSKGAFLVFELTSNDPEVMFYVLLKYDHREVLELRQENGVASLRAIVDALVSERSAVQKAAIVRVNGGTAGAEISTQDRTSARKPGLTDFFERYLEVTRSRNDEDLTTAARLVVQNTIRASRDQLGQSIPQAVARANDVLRDAPVITEDVLRNAVWVGAGLPEDEALREQLDRATDLQIKRQRLGDCEFNTQRQMLPRAVRKRIQTTEGVTILYESSLDGGAVRREQRDNGTTAFIIETRDFEQDVIPFTAGRADRQPQ